MPPSARALCLQANVQGGRDGSGVLSTPVGQCPVHFCWSTVLLELGQLALRWFCRGLLLLLAVATRWVYLVLLFLQLLLLLYCSYPSLESSTMCWYDLYLDWILLVHEPFHHICELSHSWIWAASKAGFGFIVNHHCISLDEISKFHWLYPVVMTNIAMKMYHL